MNLNQFEKMNYNLPGVNAFWFKWTMTGATTFVINRAQEFNALLGQIVRTGTGVYDLFPNGAPGVELISWSFDSIEQTRSLTSAGSGRAIVANNLVSANKVTVTFARQSDLAATDFANGDIIYGYLEIQAVKGP